MPVSTPREEDVDDPIVKKWLEEAKRRLAVRAKETLRFSKIEREYKISSSEYDRIISALNSESVTDDDLAAVENFLERHKTLTSRYSEEIEQYVERFPAVNYPRGRAIAADLNTHLDQEATVISPEGKGYLIFSTGRELVLRVIVHKLPIPDDGKSWEAIQDFRKDPESQVKLARLRKWTSAAASEEDARVIRDQIESSIVEYAEHIQIHKLAHAHSTLEVVITGAASTIEDLTRLKFGTAAKRLFAFHKSKVDLLRAEADAPERALAYLHHAYDKFKGS